MWKHKKKQNQRKVDFISQILTFLIFRLFLYKCSIILSFLVLSDTLNVYLFIIHNGRLAVIFLFTVRQILIRHRPQCFSLPSKGNDFYFLERKKKRNTPSMHGYKNDWSTKEQPICTSLFWRWIKGKLCNILCSVTYDCKAILTLSTTSLQYLMAVHILNLRALEKTTRMISYGKKQTNKHHFTAFNHEKEIHVRWTTAGR